jgi:hypothetical protein
VVLGDLGRGTYVELTVEVERGDRLCLADDLDRADEERDIRRPSFLLLQSSNPPRTER